MGSKVGKTRKSSRELGKIMVLEDVLKESIQLEGVPIGEVKREPGKYCMISDIARLDEVFRRFEPLCERLIMAPVILMISESPDEEAIFDTERLIRWLSLYGLQPYNIRVSGHYYPHELRTMIQKIKPKATIPIHTSYPEYLHALSRQNL